MKKLKRLRLRRCPRKNSKRRKRLTRRRPRNKKKRKQRMPLKRRRKLSKRLMPMHQLMIPRPPSITELMKTRSSITKCPKLLRKPSVLPDNQQVKRLFGKKMP